ncbi:hypothetical protein BC628DRAFT_1040131 [Trametes gibbosa]|nr:hypothetical protein BC628DRAFT_1040131 [Trametes gibbosa]
MSGLRTRANAPPQLADKSLKPHTATPNTTYAPPRQRPHPRESRSQPQAEAPARAVRCGDAPHVYECMTRRAGAAGEPRAPRAVYLDGSAALPESARSLPGAAASRDSCPVNGLSRTPRQANEQAGGTAARHTMPWTEGGGRRELRKPEAEALLGPCPG